MNVASLDSDIELRPATKAKIVYKGPKNAKPKVTLNSGKLSITQKEISKSTNFKWIPFGFFVTSGPSTIIIYLPKKQLTNLKIATDDGDIDGDGIINAQQIHLKSDDGDVDLETIKAHSGSISTSDGDISLSHLISQTGFKVAADDGDIEIDHTNASGYKVSSDDGDLTVNGDDYDNHFYSKLNSKNVLIAHSDDGDLDLN